MILRLDPAAARMAPQLPFTAHSVGWRTSASRLGLVVACLMGFAGNAHAQAGSAEQQGEGIEVAEASDNGAASNQDLVITGSRITGFSSPTPVTAVSSEQLALTGKYSVQQLQEDIPALIPNQATQMVSSPPGGSTFNLRGLGAQRTLLLVDGRRMAPTSPEGTTDVNILPVSLIQRVEIVTGGASAAYGSDAVAGAVNLFLKKDFQGVEAYGQLGLTSRGDSFERVSSLTWGDDFDGGRGHFVLAGSVFYSDGVNDQSSRKWGQHEWAQFANPLYVAGSNNGQPRLILTPNTRHSQMSYGGVIVAGPLRGTQFGPGGTPIPFNYGQYVGAVFMVGGDGSTFSPTGNLTPDIDRRSLYGRADYDLTDTVKLWVEGLYSRSHQRTDITPNYDSGSLTIQRDNAFLPASIRQAMIDNNITSFRFGRATLEQGFNIADSIYDVKRYAAGVEGSIGSNWRWSAYYQYADNKYNYRIFNNRIQSRWLAAIDAVLDPATGTIKCRSTLTNPNNGCVPANVFGPNSISQSAVDYITGTMQLLQTQTQHDAAFNIEGTLLKNWAGDVHLAFGGEYRRDATEGTVDATSAARDWRVLNPQPLSGAQSVREGYVETLVPLLADLPFARSLDLNAALRYTDYTISGGVTTWKIGLNYVLNDAVRVRATRSRDIRAPNINELFQSQGSNPGQIIDPLTNQNISTNWSSGGNPDLVPEKADSWTAGVVLSPGFLPGLQLSIDYYDISISGAISLLAAQQVVDGCYILKQTNLCSGVTRDPVSNAITSVAAVRFNADEVKTQGLDIEVAYRTGLTNISENWNGNISFRLLGTYVGKLATTSSGVTIDRAGQVQGGGAPHWRVNLNTIYRDGPLTLNTQLRWVQGGKRDATFVEGIDINDNRVGGRFYVNTSADYDLNDVFAVFLKVDNLFDNDPPVTTNGVAAPQTATSPYYDVLGRRYAAGVRARF
ncbi:TonB-dependent receptor domain-containing protein [Sphingobium sp. SYK-6]|uniref:TonB-dependent receptor domain-containing protein n=1 Tax=Sphingobium sp. (strain NBRC 103272 / SYK-6) TaxID=627192 RepID=UPI0002F1F069|nr:TonB-dependent receptor [Sphingobium sp. SYK-6]